MKIGSTDDGWKRLKFHCHCFLFVVNMFTWPLCQPEVVLHGINRSPFGRILFDFFIENLQLQMLCRLTMSIFYFTLTLDLLSVLLLVLYMYISLLWPSFNNLLRMLYVCLLLFTVTQFI